jgi:hypothetical protein
VLQASDEGGRSRSVSAHSSVAARGHDTPFTDTGAATAAGGGDGGREPTRAQTIDALTRRLLHRPSQEELLIRHVMKGSAHADPALVALQEAVTWKQTVDHLHRRLRDRASVEELVARGVLWERHMALAAGATSHGAAGSALAQEIAAALHHLALQEAAANGGGGHGGRGGSGGGAGASAGESLSPTSRHIARTLSEAAGYDSDAAAAALAAAEESGFVPPLHAGPGRQRGSRLSASASGGGASRSLGVAGRPKRAAGAAAGVGGGAEVRGRTTAAAGAHAGLPAGAGGDAAGPGGAEGGAGDRGADGGCASDGRENLITEDEVTAAAAAASSLVSRAHGASSRLRRSVVHAAAPLSERASSGSGDGAGASGSHSTAAANGIAAASGSAPRVSRLAPVGSAGSGQLPPEPQGDLFDDGGFGDGGFDGSDPFGGAGDGELGPDEDAGRDSNVTGAGGGGSSRRSRGATGAQGTAATSGAAAGDRSARRRDSSVAGSSASSAGGSSTAPGGAGAKGKRSRRRPARYSDRSGRAADGGSSSAGGSTVSETPTPSLSPSPSPRAQAALSAPRVRANKLQAKLQSRPTLQHLLQSQLIKGAYPFGAAASSDGVAACDGRGDSVTGR